MPRYFFHVQNGQDIPDHEGSVLDDDDAARIEAVAASGELIRDHARTFWTGGDWRMHVMDGAGATVCKLRFADMAA